MKILVRGILLGIALWLLALFFIFGDPKASDLFSNLAFYLLRLAYMVPVGIIIVLVVTLYIEVLSWRRKAELLQKFFFNFPETEGVLKKVVCAELTHLAGQHRKSKEELKVLEKGGLDAACEIVGHNNDFASAHRMLCERVKKAKEEYWEVFGLAKTLSGDVLPELSLKIHTDVQ